MEILAIIPARGGSKGIPKKNIKIFGGVPLIVHSIKTAQEVGLITRVIVSTDSVEIAKIAKEYGAEIPFMRPASLAEDDTTDLPVFKHCLEWLKLNENYYPDIVIQLRPTSPLRTKKMVEDSIHLLMENKEADSVRCVCAPRQNPYKMWTIKKNGFLAPLIQTDIAEAYNQPHQKLPPVYWQNGYIDCIRYDTIMVKHSMSGDKIIPLILNSNNYIDIDDHLTFDLAERLFLDKK